MKYLFLLIFAGLTVLFSQNYTLNFDGDADYVLIPDVLETSAGTVEMWIKPGLTGSTNTVMGNGPVANITLAITVSDSKQLHFAAYDGSNWREIYSPVDAVKTDKWNHIAAVWDGSYAKLYLNGALTDSVVCTNVKTVSSAWYLGASAIPGYMSYFSGQIDEVRIWSDARTAQEISDNLDGHLTGSESGLIAYYKMSDGAGTILSDDHQSGSRDGSIFGDTEWTVLPFSAGYGIQVSPYRISVLADLENLSDPANSAYWADHFIQTADIDASATSTWDPDGSGGYYGWSPVGSFSGNYEGDNFTIDSLYINRTNSDYQGFFGLLFNGSSVSNLRITSCDIKGRNKVGCLAGESIGTATNCYAEGVLKASGGGGGLIGLNRTEITDCHANVSMEYPGGGLVNFNEGIITDCHATGDVSGYYANGPAGGLVAYNYGTITGSYASGNAGCQWGSSVGGLAAENYSLIQNSYATGAVSGLNSNGGLVGYNSGTGAVIEYCYAEGPVTDLQVSNWNSSGGLVGYNASGTIRNSYSRGNVALGPSNAGGTDYMAGFAGRNYQGKIINCYSTGLVSHNSDTGIGFTSYVDTGGGYEMSGNFWDIDTSGQATSAGDASGITTGMMKTESTFSGAGWDFTDIWSISVSLNNGYPYFQWRYPAPEVPGGVNIAYTSSDPVLSWQAVPDATSYNIYSSADPYADFSTWTLETTVSELTWTDENAAEDKKFYVVVAVN